MVLQQRGYIGPYVSSANRFQERGAQVHSAGIRRMLGRVIDRLHKALTEGETGHPFTPEGHHILHATNAPGISGGSVCGVFLNL